MDKPDTLLMFSGGLDSTGLFWKLMREGCSLHVHHLRLFNVENRALAEDRAADHISTSKDDVEEVHAWLRGRA